MYTVVVFVMGIVACQSQRINEELFKVCKNRKPALPVVKVVNALSKTQCAIACMDDILCGSSTYHTNNQSCELFTNSYPGEECETIGSTSEATLLIKNGPICIHGGSWNGTRQNCGTCDLSYAGTYCERHIIDCLEGKLNGQKGIHTNVLIQPNKAPVPFQAKCDFDYGMTTVERRGECGSIGNFSQNWMAYRGGFGDMTCNYFIGLENLHLLTTQRASTLKVQSHANGGPSHSAYYDNFFVDNEDNNYTMYYSKFWSHPIKKAGDGFGMGAPGASLNGAPFCTPDHDCHSCAQASNSGWWFNINCSHINLHVADANKLKWPLDEFDTTAGTITLVMMFLE